MKRKKYDRKLNMSRMPLALLTASLLLYISSNAQLKGTHLVGDAGLQAGTQPPPSFTLVVPVYNYHTSKLIKANGDKIDAPSINAFLVGIGGSLVSDLKFLGGNYGATVLFAFMSSRIEGDSINTSSNLGFSDTYIQPIQLGWKTEHADFSAGYALYIPTGKYELGAQDNTGLGMFTNELSAGATVYFDAKKEWNFSALFSYAINDKKKNTGNNKVTVGNLFTWEGGLGKTWYKKAKKGPLPIIINGGIVYYLQFKTTEDKMDIPSISSTPFTLSEKDHAYAVGAEANIFIPGIRGSIGLRWLGELGAKNRTQGNTFLLTIAPYIKFLQPKKQ